MSQISNRFYVTALEDGTTLHGSLSVIGSVTQAWNQATQSAVPNWKTSTSSRPTIYLNLLSGNDYVVPTSGTWYYNGTAITSSDTRFSITTNTVTYGGQSYTMPALKIIDNLASSSNVDVDTIEYSGIYTDGTASVPFRATIQVRISVITSSSAYIGVINFVNGVRDIVAKNDIITMYGKLYGSDGSEVSSYTTTWTVNGNSTSGTSITVGSTTYSNAFRVYENSSQSASYYVTDHATVSCAFKVGNVTKFTDYVDIDDIQDPEFMYIQSGMDSSNVASGNASSLRKGQNAVFKIWVGRRDNAAVDTSFTTFKAQLLDGNGDVITTADGLPNPDAQGWRTLSVTSNVATITIPYEFAASHYKNITGIVIASN